MSLSKPVPNLDLMSKIANAWDSKMRKVVAKNKDLRKYMGKGGVRIPAILTNIFKIYEGPNVYSRGFGCYLLNTHSAEPEDSEALCKDGFPGHEKIKLKVIFSPKEGSPPPPPEIGPHPEELFLTSRSSATFQTGDMETLGKLRPGQIVMLNGLNARTYVATKDGPPRWGLSYDVQMIEAIHGLTTASLWTAARGAGTDFLMPNEMFFNEDDKSSRYNRDATHILSVFATPTTEDGRKERLERMWRENGETSLVSRDWNDKTWSMDAFPPNPRKKKASLELIHTATLLHDDIIDSNDTRRGQLAAPVRFGLADTLVTGDFLFSRAFEVCGRFEPKIVAWAADACVQLTEGEIMQGRFRRNTDVTEADYLEIIGRKTASLFAAGARIAAYLAGRDQREVAALDACGREIGMAFQMIDDVLDIEGDENRIGKRVGTDLLDGNPSLPVVLGLDIAAVRDAFLAAPATEGEVRAALVELRKAGIPDHVCDRAVGHARRAADIIETLDPSPYKDALSRFVAELVARDI